MICTRDTPLYDQKNTQYIGLTGLMGRFALPSYNFTTSQITLVQSGLSYPHFRCKKGSLVMESWCVILLDFKICSIAKLWTQTVIDGLMMQLEGSQISFYFHFPLRSRQLWVRMSCLDPASTGCTCYSRSVHASCLTSESS